MDLPFGGRLAQRRGLTVLTWLFTWLGTGLVVAFLWLVIARAAPVNAQTPWLNVWLQLLLVGLTGAILLLFTRPFSPQRRTDLLLIALGLFFFVGLALRLKNTPFTVGGINGDARFYTTYVTKMAAYGGYGDMFYRDLPAYYPPLYYFILGRVADWFNLEPFRVMKFGLFAVVLGLPFATAWLWRRLVDVRLVGMGALVMLVYPDWFKPNEWIALACIIPWWLHWVDNLTGYQPPTRWAWLRWWLVGGLIGSLIFQLYFFWFFVGGVTLLVKLGWWLGWRRQDQALRRRVINSVLMLGVTALLSSIFWGPYLYSMYTTGGWQPLQNRFFGESKTAFPLPFLEPSWSAVVYGGGLLYLILNAGQDRLARGLLWLVGGFYAWVLIGYGALIVEMPLLTFRSYPFIEYLLGLAALLALLRFWYGDYGLAQLLPATFSRRTLATALLVFVVLIFANGVINELLTQENVQDSVDAVYPAVELAAFDTLTGGDYQGRVGLVTDGYRSILFFRPLFSFIAWSAHFSHPAGRFHDRTAFLEKLAQTHDGPLFAAALRHNAYSPIDYILLQRAGADWQLNYVDDNFPDRTIDREIYFPGELFATPFFTTSTVADYTMLKPVTAVAPLAAVAQAETSLADTAKAARAYLLATRFGDDIDLPAVAGLQTQAATRLVTADLTTLPVELLLDLYGRADVTLRTKVEAALATALTLPQPVTLVDEAGTAQVRLLGYRLQPSPTGGADLDLYFDVLAPLPQAYTIWFHAYRGEAQFNFDHTPTLLTTAWQPGSIYRDRYHLDLAPGEYRFAVGLWQSEQDIRLTQGNGEWGVELGIQPVP